MNPNERDAIPAAGHVEIRGRILVSRILEQPFDYSAGKLQVRQGTDLSLTINRLRWFLQGLDEDMQPRQYMLGNLSRFASFVAQHHPNVTEVAWDQGRSWPLEEYFSQNPWHVVQAPSVKLRHPDAQVRGSADLADILGIEEGGVDWYRMHLLERFEPASRAGALNVRLKNIPYLAAMHVAESGASLDDILRRTREYDRFVGGSGSYAQKEMLGIDSYFEYSSLDEFLPGHPFTLKSWPRPAEQNGHADEPRDAAPEEPADAFQGDQYFRKEQYVQLFGAQPDLEPGQALTLGRAYDIAKAQVQAGLHLRNDPGVLLKIGAALSAGDSDAAGKLFLSHAKGF